GIFNWNYEYIMCHELMHALGVQHEQCRSDRGAYVAINYANICQNCCFGGSCNYNFDIVHAATPVGPYDFDSVMHYGQFDFSGNGLTTITCLPPYQSWQNLIGQVSHLSDGDKQGLVSRYGAPTCPVFGTQPHDALVSVGGSAAFTALATGAGSP